MTITDDGVVLTGQAGSISTHPPSGGPPAVWPVDTLEWVGFRDSAGSSVLLSAGDRFGRGELWAWSQQQGLELITTSLLDSNYPYDVAISADGRWVAYARYAADGSGEAVLRDRATGQERLLGPGWEFNFSFHGQWLAARANAQTQLLRPEQVETPIFFDKAVFLRTGEAGARGLVFELPDPAGRVGASLFDAKQRAVTRLPQNAGGWFPASPVAADEESAFLVDADEVLWRVDLRAGSAASVATGVLELRSVSSHGERVWYSTSQRLHVTTGEGAPIASYVVKGKGRGLHGADGWTFSWHVQGTGWSAALETVAVCGEQQTLTPDGEWVGISRPDFGDDRPAADAWVVYLDGPRGVPRRLVAHNVLTRETAVIEDAAEAARLSPGRRWLAYTVGDTLYRLPMP